MLPILNKASSIQKAYDSSYLIFSTATYHEKQGNVTEALRSWKDCLSFIQENYSSRSISSYKPKNDAEKNLIESLRTLETRCKERVSTLETHLQMTEGMRSADIDSNALKAAENSWVASSPDGPDAVVNSQTVASPPPVGSPKLRQGVRPGDNQGSRKTRPMMTTLRANTKPKRSPVLSPAEGSAASKAAFTAWSVTSKTPVSPLEERSNSFPSISSMYNKQTDALSVRRHGEGLRHERQNSEPVLNMEKRQKMDASTSIVADFKTAQTIMKFFYENRALSVSIEFVPPGMPAPVTIVENNIGITKAGLMSAFLAIHPEYNSLVSRFKKGPLSNAQARNLMDATTILVLMDREHLTAINARKRLLQSYPHLFKPQEELLWVTSFLTSNLNKHVKGPLLWQHRKWVSQELLRIRPSTQWLHEELSVVKKAGEVHPRNYYAWQHARWVLGNWLPYEAPFDELPTQEMVSYVFEDLSNTTMQWCCSHVSDVSGFSFLQFLYQLFLRSRPLTHTARNAVRSMILSQLKEIIDFGWNIARDHESLWVFVRTVLTDGFLEASDLNLTPEIETERKALVDLVGSWTVNSDHRASTVLPRVPISRGPASCKRDKAEPVNKERNDSSLIDAVSPSQSSIPETNVPLTDGIPPLLPVIKENIWEDRVKKALKNLGKGVEQNAANQILSEIVVQGDEVHWDDIAGLDGAKNALKEVVVYPFLRPDLFSGLREPARGMLLFGPPGTGKTMLARAVATESKSTFFSISASSLTSKYLGESEKLVRALFAIARELAPSIIFVDEIDSILSARSSNEHEATSRIKTEFLIHWSDLARAAAGKAVSSGDPSRVLVLGATNLPWAIDEAARRRFVRRQYIPLPEPSTREKQLRNLLKHQPHELSLGDMNELLNLTEGFSGSDITALAKDAALGPIRELGEDILRAEVATIRPVRFSDFQKSLTKIRPSVSKEGLKRFEEWAEKYGERV